MKASDAIAEILSESGVKVVFGFQGGSVTHIVDSIASHKSLEYIQNYNEQGSGFSADAYARIAEEGLGVAVGTNGPGATNLVTPIANAYCDSVPVLFITGQVHTFAMKNDCDVRQESFQEIDILPIVRPITKYCSTVMEASALTDELRKAIQIARSGRPGPVLIDVPIDVQGEDIDFPPIDSPNRTSFNGRDCGERLSQQLNLAEIVRMIDVAERPLILAGGGIRIAGAEDELLAFAKQTNIPVVVSLQGLDCFPHGDEHFVGFIGSYGNRYANIAIQESDLLIVLGSRLDMRQTGKRCDLFAPRAKIVHVDIDDSELNHRIAEDLGINCDLAEFLTEINGCSFQDAPRRNAWISRLQSLKSLFSDTSENEATEEVNPNLFIHEISELLNGDTIVCSDVGQNQMWVAQSFRGQHCSLRILNSGGLGAMGYSVPAGIGAYFADPKANVLCITGDGGLQMNLQELEVIGDRNLPVKVIVMNNRSLGMIRDVHFKYYDKRCVGSKEGFSQPNFELLSAAFGLDYMRVCKGYSLPNVAEALNANRPALIDVRLDDYTRVLPELLGPDSLDRQVPYRDIPASDM